MTSPDAAPQRLSDTEREAAVAALRTHLDAGRLDGDEFAERAASARAARTATDMTGLFADLPEPHPTYLTAAQPTWNTYPGGGATASATASYPRPEPGSPAAQGASIPTYSGTVLRRPGAPVPVNQTDRWLGVAHAVIWPVAILLLVTGQAGFWIIFVAIVASSALGGYQRRNRRQPPPY